MLIHPDFPGRMVQQRLERKSPASVIEQNAQPPHPAQVNLLWPTIFDSFLLSRKRSVSGKDQIPIHLLKVLLSETACVLLNTRGLSWNKPYFPPSFLVAFARNPTSFLLEATSNMIQQGTEISSPVFVLIPLIFRAVAARDRPRESSLWRAQRCSKACKGNLMEPFTLQPFFFNEVQQHNLTSLCSEMNHIS